MCARTQEAAAAQWERESGTARCTADTPARCYSWAVVCLRTAATGPAGGTHEDVCDGGALVVPPVCASGWYGTDLGGWSAMGDWSFKNSGQIADRTFWAPWDFTRPFHRIELRTKI